MHQSSPSLLGEREIQLGKPITKSPPPPDCRRHGRTNLLHRATKEGQCRWGVFFDMKVKVMRFFRRAFLPAGSIEIVLEMLRCGHRSIDAKNEDGQTAAHLAAMHGLNSILSILIRAGTNVNAKDSDSCTPLHVSFEILNY